MFGSVLRRIALVFVAVLFSGLVYPSTGSALAQSLQINSKAAVLMDYHSGRILFEHNAHEGLPPASVTKVMTLTLALEAVRDGRAAYDDLVQTSHYAAGMGGTQIWLEPGEQMPYEQLLFALAVGSANDGAVAVAEHLAGSEPAFVEAMNAKAQELGMRNTRFANPSGLPPAMVGKEGPHVTSAYDLAILSRYALGLPRFTELVSTWGPVTMRPETLQRPVLWNYNKLLHEYRGLDGIKTGMTSEAGYCLAASAMRDGVRLIAVTLGASTRAERDEDIRRLLDYGFSQLKAVKVADEGETIAEVDVNKAKDPQVSLRASDSLYVSMDRSASVEPTTEIVLTRPLTAPLREGETVGYLTASLEGEEVGRVALIAAEDVERASATQMVARYFLRLVGSP